ncbi:MAG: hypothetical protein ACOYD4_12975 [Solirubrobacterales bacterium]
MAATLESPPAARRGEMACTMCGHRFDPRQHVACRGCPLNAGCALACCPSCGFSSADPAQSWLVRGFERLRRS